MILHKLLFLISKLILSSLILSLCFNVTTKICSVASSMSSSTMVIGTLRSLIGLSSSGRKVTCTIVLSKSPKSASQIHELCINVMIVRASLILYVHVQCTCVYVHVCKCVLGEAWYNGCGLGLPTYIHVRLWGSITTWALLL